MNTREKMSVLPCFDVSISHDNWYDKIWTRGGKGSWAEKRWREKRQSTSGINLAAIWTGKVQAVAASSRGRRLISDQSHDRYPPGPPIDHRHPVAARCLRYFAWELSALCLSFNACFIIDWKLMVFYLTTRCQHIDEHRFLSTMEWLKKKRRRYGVFVSFYIS